MKPPGVTVPAFASIARRSRAAAVPLAVIAACRPTAARASGCDFNDLSDPDGRSRRFAECDDTFCLAEGHS